MTEPARIVVYVRSVSGGAGKNAVKYANILAEAGHEVAFAAGRAPQLDQFNLRRDLIRLELLGARHHVGAGLRLRRVIAAWRPDTCLVVGATNMLGLRLGLRGIRPKPTVILREALYTWERLARRSWPVRHYKRWRLARSYARTDRVIALTHGMAEQIAERYAVPRERITVIPNAVPMPEHPPAPAARGGPARLLCVARLGRQKNVGLLLEAFARLCRDRDLELRIAGDGPQRRALEQQARALGIAGAVTFLGHVADIDAEYRAAALFVLPSLWEGFPNVVIEALAHGVPVVATATAGAAEILDGQACGRLARMNDAEDLATQIAATLDAPPAPEALHALAANYSDAHLRRRVRALFDRETAT